MSNPDDAEIRSILKRVTTIAMVGASDNPSRPSYIAFKYLKERGYRMIPVNPLLAAAGTPDAPATLLGERVFASLADIDAAIDMVDIFRNSAAAGAVTDEALALDPLPAVLWMQLGVIDEAAAARAKAKGLTVVMDRCPKIEFGRMSGEIGWTGVATGMISSKKPLMAQRGFQKWTIG